MIGLSPEEYKKERRLGGAVDLSMLPEIFDFLIYHFKIEDHRKFFTHLDGGYKVANLIEGQEQIDLYFYRGNDEQDIYLAINIMANVGYTKIKEGDKAEYFLESRRPFVVYSSRNCEFSEFDLKDKCDKIIEWFKQYTLN